MAILSPSFLALVVILFYCATFALFAIIRIATGLSIQRIGYFSLRRITYTLQDGIRVDVRGLGLHLHRPTFAQPTWLSLRLTELKITIDTKKASTPKAGGKHGRHKRDRHNARNLDDTGQRMPRGLSRSDTQIARSRTWKRLTQMKEKIKQLHGKIQWIRMVDVEILNSSLVIIDVGSIQLGSLTMGVDTRRKTVDRGRLFRHKKVPEGSEASKRPAEWVFVAKKILFTQEGKESLDLLDIGTLNIHGLLYQNLAGLRDVSISLKLGRIHVPYDDLMACHNRIQRLQSMGGSRDNMQDDKDVTFTDVVGEFDMPGSREESIVQTVSDSKEFISSLLRGIQEIQMAVSFIGLSKRIRTIQPAGAPLYVNLAMNEFGIDLYRLDSKSPAHRMYFSAKDVAHQALLAAISIAISIDDGESKPERLLYIPMATTTVKTTLPSRTIVYSEDKNAAERNANMLFANMVVTSPSIDLELKHLPIALGLLQGGRKSKPPQDPGQPQHHLISRLLPKASIKFSVQEPVARMVLPPIGPTSEDSDYDLLISSISSISLDLESSHAAAGDLHYALTSTFRASAYEFYYQAANGNRFDLLLANALELKGQLSATPDVSVSIVGNAQDFSIHMVRPELTKGLHQVVKQIKRNPNFTKLDAPATNRLSILRRAPPWLVHFQFQGSNFGMQLAGVDPGVSNDTRGMAIQVETWSIDYKLHKDMPVQKKSISHRIVNNSASGDESFLSVEQSAAARKISKSHTDGRRMTVHLKGLEGFVVEAPDVYTSDPFVSLPRFEVALSTSSDSSGPIFHVNSHIKAIYVEYSLYTYYAVGVAYSVFTKIFRVEGPLGSSSKPNEQPNKPEATKPASLSHESMELLTADLRAGLIQVKAQTPSDPPLMLRVWGLEGVRHRWAAPFVRLRLLRLYAEAPKLKPAWAKLVGVKQLRVDVRDNRRKIGKDYVKEHSIDIVTDHIRLAVPHQLIIHSVMDNVVNVLKASEQMHHRFHTGTTEYILSKGPQKPKQVPRISLRTKALLFELEDGIFDWKLGVIYRTGLVEQKQRLAREAAFHLKEKKLHEHHQRRGSSRFRAQSAHQNAKSRGRSQRLETPAEKKRSKSMKLSRSRSRRPPPLGARNRSRYMRYDPDSGSELTPNAQMSIEEAETRLHEYNAQSWKKRIDFVFQFQKQGMRDIRGVFCDDEDLVEEMDETELILAIPDRPGLMVVRINDFHVLIDKPSFPLDQYASFLQQTGKGIPRDTKYAMLIPMNIQINMGETRVSLRDYPLPLVHVPPLRPGQSPRLSCWSLKTDFVIAEEYRDSDSIKHMMIEVIPPNKITSPPDVKKGFAIDVHRTVSPVKTYSDVQITINTSDPTGLTWGTSYQPAIQDMMQIIEGFSKPQVDPSDRVGFWDKIRLNVHSRVKVAWKGDGDVHLKLKGSRSPYVVTGYGAGLIMVFRNNVSWGIHLDDNPKKFMTVESGEYVLAIPDYSHQARKDVKNVLSDNGSMASSTMGSPNNAMFTKTVMKLSGNVRWMAGIVFERDKEDGGRSFESIPHYQVTLKTPSHAKTPPGKTYDAFRGFRSQYIHLSIAVVAPLDRDWSVTNSKPSASYNSIHLTPRFFTHFFDWWSLFSGVMSLPVRQGKLFPGVEKSSKKFGRHLATIKYHLLLSPLFIAHIYKHKDAEDYADDVVSATGLKLRIDSFMLDLHQRREEFAIISKGRSKPSRTNGMRINQVQLDFLTADLRAVSATIRGTSQEAIARASEAEIASYSQLMPYPDLSRFIIPDQDFLWVDMDDFVEPQWILPAETHPETKIMPLAFAPRFTYFRQTDHGDNTHGDTTRSSAFGNEPTHFCIMSEDNDPQKVQQELVRERLAAIDTQIDTHRRNMGEQALRVVRDGFADGNLKVQHDVLTQQNKILNDKRAFVQQTLARIEEQIERNKARKCQDPTAAHKFYDAASTTSSHSTDSLDNESLASELEFPDDFNNRFIIHNIQLKWNNSLRNIILRYVHQVSQRRGFVYYMSRRAVKFILDIIDEQDKNRQRQNADSEQATPGSQSSPAASFGEALDKDNEQELQDRIQQILQDGKDFVEANEPKLDKTASRRNTTKLDHDISEEYTPQNSYHVRLIAPQIQLQSEKNAKAVLLITAKGMQLKVIQIMDKTRLTDDISGLVQRRFSLDMEGAQFFVASQKTLAQFLHLYSANRYGMPKGSSWPPWVPVEVNFDFQLNPFGFARVVQRTSASLRYDKYNTLRLKYNDEVSKGDATPSQRVDDPENRIDHLWVDFPQVRAVCDSAQYYTMYLIVLDLLLYTEPLEKVRSERLEKIMLAADFSDLKGAPEMVISLQERICQLEEIKAHFQLHAKYLDRQGWQDRLTIERDLTSCEDELFFMMKAITTSQRKYDDRSQASQNGLLRWYLSASEVVWHLMREKQEPLMEIQLHNATYDRIDNSDGSNNNVMEIQRLHGLNLLPNSLYPEMLAPYIEKNRTPNAEKIEDIKMLKVQWIMLEAIAGIPVLDQFEVNLFPIKIQLEREVGKKLFEYVFPGGPESGASPFLVKHMPIVQDEDEDEESDGELLSMSNSNGSLSVDPDDQYASTRAGSLELRLRPTLNLPDTKPRPKTSASHKTNGLQAPSTHRFKIFPNSSRPHSPTRSNASFRPTFPSRNTSHIAHKRSDNSLRSSTHEASSTSLSTMNPNSADRSKRFNLHRSPSSNSTLDASQANKASDDLTQMLSRASNYMTLAYVKIPSVVLCLSYKGKGERNIEDVHDFVFRMPSLEYRNKTWSNLDLALRLKKDVIKALISHTGAIIGNKFSQKRPSKQTQSRLRQIANSSILVSNMDSLTNGITNEITNGIQRTKSMRRGRSRSPGVPKLTPMSDAFSTFTGDSLDASSVSVASPTSTFPPPTRESTGGLSALQARGKSFVASSFKTLAEMGSSRGTSEEPEGKTAHGTETNPEGKPRDGEENGEPPKSFLPAFARRPTASLIPALPSSSTSSPQRQQRTRHRDTVTTTPLGTTTNGVGPARDGASRTEDAVDNGETRNATKEDAASGNAASNGDFQKSSAAAWAEATKGSGVGSSSGSHAAKEDNEEQRRTVGGEGLGQGQVPGRTRKESVIHLGRKILGGGGR